MQQEMEELRQNFRQELNQVASAKEVGEIKVRFLGKKGPVQGLMKHLKSLTPEERPQFGKQINDLKVELSQQCEELLEELQSKEESLRLEKERIDISLPGKRRFSGRKHPITKMLDHVLEILKGMGFSVQYGPDIETDYYNFESLNFAKDHPARDMQDTFYLEDSLLLRTHTSNIQARVAEANNPPIRIIAPGKCYRNETITARSHVFFHQVEALYIDDGVTFADLQATLEQFLSKLFEKKIKTRFRPSYFPFVEPGMEVDIDCLVCEGKGCSICKKTGWLEVAGAGMVHIEVLKNMGIDIEKYTGFAWGLGIERLVMLKYGIKDIRLFTENDMRFLKQFA